MPSTFYHPSPLTKSELGECKNILTCETLLSDIMITIVDGFPSYEYSISEACYLSPDSMADIRNRKVNIQLKALKKFTSVFETDEY
jgi:hypothetical protein